jgi:hypothetical protein
MELKPANVHEHPDVSAEEHAAHDLIQRILKLRWMGMEDEAMQMQLVLRRVEPGVTVMAGPYDTD